MAEEEVKQDEMPAIEDGAEGEDSGDEGGGSGGLSKIIFAAVPALAAALITALVFWLFVLPDDASHVSEGENEAGESHEQKNVEHDNGKQVETHSDENKENTELVAQEVRKEAKDRVTKIVPLTDESKFIFPLDPMVVNIFDRTTIRYLRIALSLGYEQADLKARFEQQVPRIKDAIIFIMGDASVRELNDSAGKELLKEDILAAVNRIIGDDLVTNVYFTEFTLQ